ncbi:hypothetical protein Pyn_28255 [Prunus yedoensis var. nudiflora]|uniref:Uncharacterized protein n=1 Tax=Prunus yedoensis var. nudiflora TaxID=2094558 RepID=A0A314YTY9_PRUYE|nr:hypothetical protein Pyn_28255 [Prunus yedoensis var. nudiflora]
MPSTKPFLLFPFCPFPFASLSLQRFVRSEISSPFRTSWLGWLGGSHGRSAFTVLHAWGAVDFRLGRRAANPAALLVFISLVFLSDVAFE